MKFPGQVQATVEAAAEPRPAIPGVRAAVSRTLSFSDAYDPGPNPAMVGGSVGFNSSGNYRSLQMSVRCEVPSKPDAYHMVKRTLAAYELMYKILDAQAPVLAELQRRLGMDVPPNPAPGPAGMFDVRAQHDIAAAILSGQGPSSPVFGEPLA